MTGGANGLPAALFYWSPEDAAPSPRARISRALGHGRRLVVPVDPGRKLVTLVAVGDLAHVRLPLEELRHTDRADLMPAHLVKRMRAKARAFDRLGVAYSKRTVKRAIARLRNLKP
jgi:hypothetical protein